MKKYIFKILSYIYYKLEMINLEYVYNSYRQRYNIAPSFIFNGKGIILYGEGKIEIGNNSYVGRHSSIQSSKNCSVKIGKNCKIGPFFCIWTESSKVDYDYNFCDKIESKVGDIFISDAVWIGANVVISPGVTIGENSIIGANSLVTKDVPPYAIVGGVPAKVLRYKNIEKI